MKNNFLASLGLLTLSFLPLVAQVPLRLPDMPNAGSTAPNSEPVLKFENADHDFGTIIESGGPKKHRFTFINAGKAPLKIANVQASCGCTTPAWTTTEVPSGGRGFVEAEYNPQGRPGAFSKQLTVTSNAQPPITVLSIKGMVKEKEKTPVDLYPDTLAGGKTLRMVSRYMNFGRLSPQTPNVQRFKIFNESKKHFALSLGNAPGKYVSIKFFPSVLAPGATGEIEVNYDAKMRAEWGYVNESIDFEFVPVAGSKSKPAPSAKPTKAPLFVVGSIENSPKTLNKADSATAPLLKFEKIEHNFGDINAGDILNYEFIFKNAGKAPLVLFKTKASCGCTASDPAKTTLRPGENSSIKITFNTTGKPAGSQYQSVTIYSNDPAAPTQYINIRGNIKDKNAPAIGQKTAPAPLKP